MMTPFKTKTLIFPLLFSLMIVATLLWPVYALADEPICKSEPFGLAIPDGPDYSASPGTPVTSALTVTNPALINDLNIVISTNHSYVGDLVFTLTHRIDTAFTQTILINQPLLGQSTLPGEVSCSGDDIFVTLDDEAIPDIQVNCAEGTSEGDGTKAYIDDQSYKPYSPLNIFDTDTLSGTWELTITDNYTQDIGSLWGWCLVPNTYTENDLQIFKSAMPLNAVQGQPLTYTLSYKNLSNSQTATGIVITDVIPLPLADPIFSSSQTITRTSGITYEWQVPDLAPGEGGVITVSGTLSPDTLGGTSFVNMADIMTTSAETNTTNNHGEATVFVRRPDLQVSKSDGGLTAMPGSFITYTLAYTNAQGRSTGVILTEDLPANTSFVSGSAGWQRIGTTTQYTYSAGNLNLNEGGIITFVIQVDDPLPTGVNSVINNTEISDDGSNGLDENSGDNTSTINTLVNAAPDLVVTKTDADITVTPGSLITYTLTYTNKGNQDATGVVITETLPANTTFNAAASSSGWHQVGSTRQYTRSVVGTLSRIQGGQIATFVVTVDNPLPQGTNSITNTVQIGGSGGEQDLSDNYYDKITPVIISFKVYLPIILREN